MRNGIVRITIMLGAVLAVGYGIQRLYFGITAYRGASQYYRGISSAYVKTPAPETTVLASFQETGAAPAAWSDAKTEDGDPVPVAIDFSGLQADCPDAVGWLYGLGGEINLPVMQREDNLYYLTHLPSGEESRSGSLFLDFRCSGDFSDEISFIYGHNMKNGTMLEAITDYQNAACYKAHPVMYLLTPERTYEMEIFAGFLTDVEGEAYRFSFDDTLQKEQYIQDLQAASDFAFQGEVTAEDRILCLSTCSYAFENARYVLFSKLTEIR